MGASVVKILPGNLKFGCRYVTDVMRLRRKLKAPFLARMTGTTFKDYRLVPALKRSTSGWCLWNSVGQLPVGGLWPRLVAMSRCAEDRDAQMTWTRESSIAAKSALYLSFFKLILKKLGLWSM